MLVETVLLYIVGIVVVVIGVAISIGLHELGHLVPAKLFKVRVGQYMIGFGPTLFSRRKGETEYGVKAIPLGGYISMAGMYPPAKEGERPLTSGTDAFPVEREYEAEVGGRKRSNFFQAMVQDARTASADAIPIGAEDRVFYKLSIWKRIIIMVGGPFMNLVIAFVLFGVILSAFGMQQLSVGSVSQCVVAAPSTRTTCEASDPVAPAAAAGLAPGDQILQVGSLKKPTWDHVTSLIQKSASKPLVFTVVRAGAEKKITVTPLLTTRDTYDSAGKVVKDSQGKPVTVKVGFIGVGPSYPLVRQPFGEALPTLGNNLGSDFQIIATLPQRLVQVASLHRC